ncbi:IPP1 [Ecytonucleospora hepatopenaei]|uniref:inorganic diphosphatase n=1 Tax=Ecytonucleospora hepatopenaei TaxID=646526 RepID=A0A1W0E5J9_9MICR|nr:IPP1 [Ecytonucleospora hepatopenaei]
MEATNNKEYDVIEIGSKYTSDYRVYPRKDGNIISPFHDIITHNEDGTYNCINEIPRFENAKFEVSKEDEFNPIKQDVKKDKVRFIKNIFPTKGYPANYGAFPRTFEDPKILDKFCNALGDNDPLDCVDISNVTKEVGSVYKAKVLGCLAMLDGGEADWKIIVIDVKDCIADKVNDLCDVKKHFPGFLENLFAWFRDYKKPDGKPENSFALNGEYQNAEFAKNIVKEASKNYEDFVKKGGDNKICLKSSLKGDSFEVLKKNDAKEGPVPDFANHFYFSK